jgi:hypothetical protein
MPVYPGKMINVAEIDDAYRLRLDDSATLTIAQSFPTMGAKQIGFHITYGIHAETTSMDLFAASSSCTGRNAEIDRMSIDGTWGVSYGRNPSQES